MDFLFQPWHWFVSGFLIACTMLFLLLMGKKFGMSSNLRTFCAACGAGKVNSFFKFDWKSDVWNLLVVIGAMLGGFIASHYLSATDMPAISDATKASLSSLNISTENQYLPVELFSISALSDIKPL